MVKPAFAPITDGKIQLRDGAIWAIMDYEEFAKELKSILPLVENKDSYHGRLLCDYGEFISLLNDIAKATEIDPQAMRITFLLAWDPPYGFS